MDNENQHMYVFKWNDDDEDTNIKNNVNNLYMMKIKIHLMKIINQKLMIIRKIHIHIN